MRKTKGSNSVTIKFKIRVTEFFKTWMGRYIVVS